MSLNTSRSLSLNTDDLLVESFSTSETSQELLTNQQVIGIGGVSEWPMICSCFGTCDAGCNSVAY